MQAYAAMLDVLRESQPEQYADIMAQLQASAGGPVGAGQGERINPEPSFVIKTATVPTDRGAVRGGTKVFINVTHAAQVPGFRKRRDLSGSEAVEGLHVPIAIGPPRTDVDRAGRPCSVYDVVVNPEVTSGCVSRGGEAFRHMVCGIVMQNVEAKFGRKASPPWTLNEAYRLPTLANRYKGKLPPPAQWVRSPRKAGIETVEGEPGSQAGTAAGGGGGGAAKPGRAASPGAAAGAMTVAGDAASESVRAAMSVAEAAAAGAPVGPDGVVRVDMQVRRLGEEEEEAKAKGARPMADLQLLSVACGEESVSVAAPGHTPATVLLPAVVVPARAIYVGRAPDSDTSFPEDRFHVKDPLSLHFLQERERAKAEAEQKQLAKEAAAGPATAAQKAPAPAEYDLESEADLGLL
ncbi:hypothetical protein FNF29_04141 [Cafeteria roenbergensis]|uniref:PIH1 N-terminal domain-containing protein n=1 Tax=Cafeteria roenbergensis TaxID=33653 RepID=A0A5A8CGC4_CAFRO|nr:hypothetical protein FNF29_04141 [Cafeteria roenbergensis]|eukprot:KAA0152026.1 hypothetical protein FNF29_04141 [Cafeteria roenbergensis]